MHIKKFATVALSASTALVLGTGIAQAAEPSNPFPFDVNSSNLNADAVVKAAAEALGSSTAQPGETTPQGDGSQHVNLISPLGAGLQKADAETATQVLTSGNLRSVAQDGAVVVNFNEDGTVRAHDGCNLNTSDYEVTPQGTLKVGDFASTLKACDPATDHNRAELLNLLKSNPSVFTGEGGFVALGTKDAAIMFNLEERQPVEPAN
ncbi:META domain-containing protein [Corynebacterium sp.]|uniref:META domain-containing protein n=1 Tax=Corynebacterium sp. TaxID=1720 RepID=UPI0026DB131C|nr:META domain-containing protein [Corynebacterium sp.]MDO5032854.1 META domain-containing protein [Corynebacterium sp.]